VYGARRRNWSAKMDTLTLLKKQFTPTKLFFHFLFWTFHWGIFAYGWYLVPRVKAAVRMGASTDG
jgi:hypothetical protein